MSIDPYVVSSEGKSPVFLSVVLGLLTSKMRFDVGGLFVAPFYEALSMVDGDLTLFACLILGIQLRLDSVRSIRDILPLVAVCMGITMVLAPWLAYVQASHFGAGDSDPKMTVTRAPLLSPILRLHTSKNQFVRVTMYATIAITDISLTS